MITITVTIEEKRTDKGIEMATGVSAVGTMETNGEVTVYESFKSSIGKLLRVMEDESKHKRLPWYKRMF